jgi:hypothetical protein
MGGSPTNIANPSIPTSPALRDEKGNFADLSPEAMKAYQADELANQQQAKAQQGKHESDLKQFQGQQQEQFATAFANQNSGTGNFYKRDASKPASAEDQIEQALQQAEQQK